MGTINVTVDKELDVTINTAAGEIGYTEIIEQINKTKNRVYLFDL